MCTHLTISNAACHLCGSHSSLWSATALTPAALLLVSLSPCPSHRISRGDSILGGSFLYKAILELRFLPSYCLPSL